jgi:uncharacterized protein (DUF1501 family)
VNVERYSEAGMSRRRFLGGLGVAATAAVAGGYGLTVWRRDPTAVAGRGGGTGRLGAGTAGHTLVVVEMGGGNDGLNTVVPLNDGTYHDLRPTLAVADPVDLDGQIGLHPSLRRLAARYRDGHVAVVEGVGYPEPDLSHFGSFDIWWSARGGSGTAGWLGRYLDGTVGFDDPLAAVGIGPSPVKALLGDESFAASIADVTGLRPSAPSWIDDTDDLLAAWSGFAPAHVDATTLSGRVARAIGLTDDAGRRLGRTLDGEQAPTPQYTGQGGYGDSSVVDSLALAARLVDSEIRPRVVYISGIGDFDTHEGQAERHPALLEQLDTGIDEFFTALPEDVADGVVLMTLSEFGRRPAENGSGTDHGTANVHFVVGPRVRGGRFGAPPSLTRLDRNGNLDHSVDFRSLYATALGWLGVEPAPVLGDDFEPLPVF